LGEKLKASVEVSFLLMLLVFMEAISIFSTDFGLIALTFTTQQQTGGRENFNFE
jgi:hypothetical protein